MVDNAPCPECGNEDTTWDGVLIEHEDDETPYLVESFTCTNYDTDGEPCRNGFFYDQIEEEYLSLQEWENLKGEASNDESPLNYVRF